ncbi:hypothetical protein [Microbulbifer sp. GL-2]|uniref:hypothetical protein n=1 Tax=Microbulbifer sp. GL-2 TaxID=2591606 RepID=UPI001164DE54|nr:hypothetical protein [Microbulbifer sp. GL-2]BBM03793.1 hypothetical protein GL2_38670 [Microbulbifer sp. GL-2]
MDLEAEISPDEVESVRGLLQNCVQDFAFFALKQLKIATKRGALEPLKLNRAQRYVHSRLEDQLFELGMVRALILKGRQQGISTYVEGRYYWKTRFRKAVKAFILTHLQQATDNLFDMVFRYHDNLHPLLKPITTSASTKELHFAQNDSGYKVATAGSKGACRSSTIHYFHGSEVAFWPHAETHAAGVLQAVPEGENSEIVFESTANGIGGYFHELWQKAESGESEFIAIFLPWYWQPEYRKTAPINWKSSDTELETAKTYNLDRDQIYWAHQKNIQLGGDVGEWGWLFLQEYPFCAADAFQQSGQDTLINTAHVASARRRVENSVSHYGAHIVGVDPARYGGDRASWIHRKGNKAWGLKSLQKTSTTQLAAKIANECDVCAGEGSPVEAIFVDEVGLGAGTVDALEDMGYPVIGINAGTAASDPEKYFNLRAEMWDNTADWLNGPVSIPDVNSLHADLIAPQYTYNVKQQLVLETKEQMRKREVRSPDEAEALALTLAIPVAAPEKPRGKRGRRRPPRNWRAM